RPSTVAYGRSNCPLRSTTTVENSFVSPSGAGPREKTQTVNAAAPKTSAKPIALAAIQKRRNTLGLFPPPTGSRRWRGPPGGRLLWARVREGGRPVGADLAPRSTPTPNPSPQGGEERIEFAARFSAWLTSQPRSPP